MASEKDELTRRDRLNMEIYRRIVQFSEYLRVMRKMKRITQKEIEAATGLTSGNLSHLENGKRVEGITLRNVMRLAFALGVQPSELVRLLDSDFGARIPNAGLGSGLDVVPVVAHSSVRSEIRDNVVEKLRAASSVRGRPNRKVTSEPAPLLRAKKNSKR